ncbi:zinc finger protein Pegasus isoform X1 [Gadus macrocephalus]|uniref:zinc finger protein Pegasus isoform X1 n=1 Tax=Gadus macrocephalus TaxID=80720 RepID=UPI0028CB6A2C|nr:zinc finger protein Pegasus isoform X1 [Gadus macrocephalus]
MGEEKPDTLDFVKDFQEYLSQQTQHVNMISGSVSGVKEVDDVPAGNYCGQNGLDHPSTDMSLVDSSGILVDGFERTYDGKLKCRYCNYATRGTARLIEHIRIHTGEKPHRCHLCPFASAYERHLEAHMRSHTGEKPYKCELCSFRCSDRSNLSHHRRRRHKLLPMKGARSLAHKKMLSVLQKKSSALGYGRRLLINFSPPSMAAHKADSMSDFPHGLPHIRQEAFDDQGGAPEDRSSRDDELHHHHLHQHHQDLVMDNPLNQLSTLAGQLASLPAHVHSQTAQPPGSPRARSPVDEKPFLVQQPDPADTPPATTLANTSHASSPTAPDPRLPPLPPSEGSPVAGPCSEGSGRTSTPSVGNSQPSTPAPGLPAAPQERGAQHHCQHCDIAFPDNILYTIHMGCHGYENAFQCNICGHSCINKYDFACHFARGQHKQP